MAFYEKLRITFRTSGPPSFGRFGLRNPRRDSHSDAAFFSTPAGLCWPSTRRRRRSAGGWRLLPASAVSSPPKPKPRWDVHLLGTGNRGGNLEGVFRPLIAGPSGSAVSHRLSGWTARPGICRPAPAPPPYCPSTDCQWPPPFSRGFTSLNSSSGVLRYSRTPPHGGLARCPR